MTEEVSRTEARILKSRVCHRHYISFLKVFQGQIMRESGARGTQECKVAPKSSSMIGSRSLRMLTDMSSHSTFLEQRWSVQAAMRAHIKIGDLNPVV